MQVVQKLSWLKKTFLHKNELVCQFYFFAKYFVSSLSEQGKSLCRPHLGKSILEPEVDLFAHCLESFPYS